MDEDDPRNWTYRQVQKALKDIGLKATGKDHELRKRLDDYLNNPDEVLRHAEEEREAAEKAKAKKKGWIDWRNSAAREILMEDLEQGGWLYGKDDMDAKEVFDIYQAKQEEFQEVPFSQFQYRYDAAIDKAKKRRERSAQEEEWMRHDRLIYPRQTHNHRGEPVFDVDIKAKEQLRQDVKDKLHEVMYPSEIWQLRSVYQKYRLEVFRFRIYQEIRRNKFLNFLEYKRTKKRRKFDAERRGESVKITRK